MKTPAKIIANEMSDNELDRLLALASRPPLVAEAQKALLAKIALQRTADPEGSVVRFPVAVKKSGSIGWLATLPLAASLAAGIWLGAAGQGTSYLFGTSDEVTSLTDNFDPSTGIDDAESLTEEDLT